MTETRTVDAEVWPEGSLEVLSQFEVDQLRGSGQGASDYGPGKRTFTHRDLGR